MGNAVSGPCSTSKSTSLPALSRQKYKRLGKAWLHRCLVNSLTTQVSNSAPRKAPSSKSAGLRTPARQAASPVSRKYSLGVLTSRLPKLRCQGGSSTTKYLASRIEIQLFAVL